jgi:hypothetical protein
MERRRRLPGAIAHAGHVLAFGAGLAQRHAPPVAREHEALLGQALDLELQALDRGIDEAHRAARGRFLAEHVPRLERVAQLDLQAAAGDLADLGEAELVMRREPGGSVLRMWSSWGVK